MCSFGVAHVQWNDTIDNDSLNIKFISVPPSHTSVVTIIHDNYRQLIIHINIQERYHFIVHMYTITGSMGHSPETWPLL